MRSLPRASAFPTPPRWVPQLAGGLAAALPLAARAAAQTTRAHSLGLLLSRLKVALSALLAYAVSANLAKAILIERSLVEPADAAVDGSRFLALDDATLHYVLQRGLTPTAPAAPPALLFCNHGFGANCLTWDFLSDALPPSLVLAAFDRVGFGLSSRPDDIKHYGPSAACSQGLELLRVVQADAPLAPPVILVGHSMGAGLSARMAVELGRAGTPPGALVLLAPAANRAEPRRLGALSRRLFLLAIRWLLLPFVRLSTSTQIYSEAFWRRGLSLALPTGLSKPIYDRYTWPVQVRLAARGIAAFTCAQAQSMISGIGPAESEADVWAALRAMSIPTLVIHGTADSVVPLRSSRALCADVLPDAELVELDCGHCPQEELPERTASTICNFLQRRVPL